jgi:hypothetical protein
MLAARGLSLRFAHVWDGPKEPEKALENPPRSETFHSRVNRPPCFRALCEVEVLNSVAGESNPGRRGAEVIHGPRKRALIHSTIPGAPSLSHRSGTGCPKLAPTPPPVNSPSEVIQAGPSGCCRRSRCRVTRVARYSRNRARDLWHDLQQRVGPDRRPSDREVMER